VKRKLSPDELAPAEEERPSMDERFGTVDDVPF
jgi:hypothetical protein